MEATLSLLEPLRFMTLALSYLPGTLTRLLLARDYATLLSVTRLRAAWFARFWRSVGPEIRKNAGKNVIPLLQGRVTHGVVPTSSDGSGSGEESHPHPPVQGTVLEVGPGTGLWVSVFSPAAQLLPGVRKVFGVEPNADVHVELRGRVAEAGLLEDGTYEIVPVGIEELERDGRVGEGSVDCIVTIMCLCSIPEPRYNCAQLYRYLKPGGRWYVYEHVRCFHSQGIFMRTYQYLLNFFWPRIIGGCEMCRDTATTLREAGPWSQVDLHPLQGEPWFYTMPHIIGVLTK